MLGTTFETNTSLHLAEYFVNRPDIEESAPVLVDGKKQWVSFKNVDLDIFDDFLDVQKEFFQKYADQIKQCSLPNGEAYCFNMRDCVDFAKAYYQVKG
jgi:aminoglycoside 3-N-acetyltransferase